MDKLKVLLIMLMAATTGLAVSMYILSLILSSTGSPIAVFTGILTHGFSPDIPFFIPLSTLLFLCTVLASMVGVIYFLVLPEMKNYVAGNGKDTISVVLKTLKPDEREVVRVLDAHGGTYLQKYITREAGLSRLKTHRVIAALSERGIVHVETQGNTNEVSLVKWFHDGVQQYLEGQNGSRRSKIEEDRVSALQKIEYVLVLIAVVLVLKSKKKPYCSLKEIREQALILEKSRGTKLVEKLEDYTQDLADRGILDIRSLNEISINGVPPEKLEAFLETLFGKLRQMEGEQKRPVEGMNQKSSQS